jgi:hypothetical protein
MNICEERHEPKYQITYKSAKGGTYIPVWLVCQSCIDNKKHFGADYEIISVKTLA